jgi:hypothetical protein
MPILELSSICRSNSAASTYVAAASRPARSEDRLNVKRQFKILDQWNKIADHLGIIGRTDGYLDAKRDEKISRRSANPRGTRHTRRARAMSIHARGPFPPNIPANLEGLRDQSL